MKYGPEDLEQIQVVNFLEEQKFFGGIKFTSIPNSTWTSSFSQKRKNLVTGLRKGLCDLFIVIEKQRSTTGYAIAFFIEMKKCKGPKGGKNGSVISKEQKEWIAIINQVKNVGAYVAYGAKEAMGIIEDYLIIQK